MSKGGRGPGRKKGGGTCCADDLYQQEEEPNRVSFSDREPVRGVQRNGGAPGLTIAPISGTALVSCLLFTLTTLKASAIVVFVFEQISGTSKGSVLTSYAGQKRGGCEIRFPSPMIDGIIAGVCIAYLGNRP